MQGRGRACWKAPQFLLAPRDLIERKFQFGVLDVADLLGLPQRLRHHRIGGDIPDDARRSHA